MGFGQDYRDACPIFDTRDGGVLFPYRIGDFAAHNVTISADLNNPIHGIDFDGSEGTAAGYNDVVFRLPFKARLLTCVAFAVSDDTGTKTGSATAEPIIAVTYGASAGATFASAGDGTEICAITCDGTGDYGSYWTGTTTETEIEAFAPIAVYLKTAAATSGTSTLQDGAAVVELWFAQMREA